MIKKKILKVDNYLIKLLIIISSLYVLITSYFLFFNNKILNILDKKLLSYILIINILLLYALYIRNRQILYIIHILIVLYVTLGPLIINSNFSAIFYILTIAVIVIKSIMFNFNCVLSYITFDENDKDTMKVIPDSIPMSSVIVIELLLIIYLIRKVKWI